MIGWFGGAEDGGSTTGGSGVFQDITGSTGEDIVSSPALAGSYSFKVDPVNGSGAGLYGFITKHLSQYSSPKVFCLLFMYRFDAGFNDEVGIFEIGNGNGGGTRTRSLVIDSLEGLILVDNADNVIINTADAYLAAATDYWFLYYYDRRDATKTRDVLWTFKAGAWDLTGDVSNAANDGDVSAVALGSFKGKTLPTSGGPMYYDEAAFIDFGKFHNRTPLGSVTTRYKIANGNGAYGDFTLGTGTNPDFNDVDEVPADDATTTDAGDADGEKQSYGITDATAGEAPLAVNVMGSQSSSGTSDQIRLMHYLRYNSTDDKPAEADYEYPGRLNNGWFRIGTNTGVNVNEPIGVRNSVNGLSFDETIFNGLEVVTEITKRDAGTQSLSLLGLEYCIAGPKALPSGFPAFSMVPLRHAGHVNLRR